MVTDFIYDDVRLSDLGYALVSFDGAKDQEITTDSQFTFNHISTQRGKKQSYITATYDDPLEMEFYIAKNLCTEEGTKVTLSAYNISVVDMAKLKRWLVRPTPHKLKLEDVDYYGMYWNGSFNVEEYVYGDGRVGAHLTFECDSPFGYFEEVEMKGDIISSTKYKYRCASDEIGYIYPNLTITLKASGDLRITNAHDGRTTIIKNCNVGEVITITENLQVSSSLSTHDVLNDFNFVFYRINNEFMNIDNTLESNLAISFIMKYTPIAKAVAI